MEEENPLFREIGKVTRRLKARQERLLDYQMREALFRENPKLHYDFSRRK